MGIFDFFKSKQTENPEAREKYDLASSQFEAEEYQDALSTLTLGFRLDVNFKPFYKLAAKCLFKMGGLEEKELFENALKNFNQFESFWVLGLHFYKAGHPDLAIPFCEKATTLNPTDQGILHILALMYAGQFQVEKALDLLDNNKGQPDFWNTWFWCKLRILSNKTDDIEEVIKNLKQTLDLASEQEEAAELEYAYPRVHELEESLSRLSLILNPEQHIRDWQFIQYGTAILDFFDEPDEYVAGGRYVALFGHHNPLKELFSKLKSFVSSIDVNVNHIVYLNSRNSIIIGLAIAKELGLNSQVYDADTNQKDCLIIAADSSEFNNHPEFAEIHSGQITFSLNHNWLEPVRICPDIIGFMSQTYSFPWDGGQIRIKEGTDSETELSEPDDRDEYEIASEIYNLPNSGDIKDSELEFYKKHRDYLKAIGKKASLTRYSFTPESPVPGAYFK